MLAKSIKLKEDQVFFYKPKESDFGDGDSVFPLEDEHSKVVVSKRVMLGGSIQYELHIDNQASGVARYAQGFLLCRNPNGSITGCVLGFEPKAEPPPKAEAKVEPPPKAEKPKTAPEKKSRRF